MDNGGGRMIMTCFTAVLIALLVIIVIIFTSDSKPDPALIVCFVLMWATVLMGIMGRWVLK